MKCSSLNVRLSSTPLPPWCTFSHVSMLFVFSTPIGAYGMTHTVSAAQVARASSEKTEPEYDRNEISLSAPRFNFFPAGRVGNDRTRSTKKDSIVELLPSFLVGEEMYGRNPIADKLLFVSQLLRLSESQQTASTTNSKSCFEQPSFLLFLYLRPRACRQLVVTGIFHHLE